MPVRASELAPGPVGRRLEVDEVGGHGLVDAGIAGQRKEHPWSNDPVADSPRGAKLAESTMAHAAVELYHSAQLRVLQRLNILLEQATHTDEDTDASDDSVQALAVRL
ncbi:hypothetical protein [Nonomuraea sp. NPDC003201]